jgi:hypothetical protein
MTKIQEKKAYFLKLKYFGRELEYKGIIQWIKKDIFKIKTDDDTCLRFNMNQIFYVKEIPENEAKSPEKIVKIGKRKKIPNSELKKIEGPEGLN